MTREKKNQQQQHMRETTTTVMPITRMRKNREMEKNEKPRPMSKCEREKGRKNKTQDINDIK